jgi:hypothetical protein
MCKQIKYLWRATSPGIAENALSLLFGSPRLDQKALFAQEKADN